jgi:RimJ/RimL family protein N-acetyltransferase
MLTAHWPLFGLRVVTPRLELRYAGDSDLFALADAAAAGIHDPAEMPFLTPWSDVEPRARARSVLQWSWQQRAALRPNSWFLTLVTVVDGQVVGTQDLRAEQFPVLREVETGSWLGQAHQNRGIGTEMRSTVLHLAFAGLDAGCATTAAFADNARSIAISRRLGYADDGVRWVVRRGQPAQEIRFRLEREQWAQRRRDDIEIHGLTDDVKRMLGAS